MNYNTNNTAKHVLTEDFEKNLWFTSDTHHGHKNLVYGVSVWPQKETSTRMFNTTEEMSQHIVDQINKYVKEDDILFHLGDWSFGGIENIWNFRKQLKVKTIYLTIGNHDHHIDKNKFSPNGNVETQKLFTSVQKSIDLEFGGKLILMSHYPHEAWNPENYQLHGHTHGTLPKIPFRLDVGMDNAFKLFGEYRPFNWNDIKSHIK